MFDGDSDSSDGAVESSLSSLSCVRSSIDETVAIECWPNIKNYFSFRLWLPEAATDATDVAGDVAVWFPSGETSNQHSGFLTEVAVVG